MTVEASVEATAPPVYETASPQQQSTIPDFEGKEVSATKAKITSTASLEVDDRVFHVDDYVRMVIEGRVVNVAHNVNDKSGDLERIHTIKAIDSRVLEWDEQV